MLWRQALREALPVDRRLTDALDRLRHPISVDTSDTEACILKIVLKMLLIKTTSMYVEKRSEGFDGMPSYGTAHEHRAAEKIKLVLHALCAEEQNGTRGYWMA